MLQHKFCTAEPGNSVKLCPPIVCDDATANVPESMREACSEFVHKHNVYGHLKSLRENNQVLRLVNEQDFVHPDVTNDPIALIFIGLLLTVLLGASLLRCICAYRKKRNKKRNFNPALVSLRRRCGRKYNWRSWRCANLQCRNSCRNCLGRLRNNPDPDAPYGASDQERQQRWRRQVAVDQPDVERKIEHPISMVGKELTSIKRLERSSAVVEADVQSDSSDLYVITEANLGSLKEVCEMMSQLVDDSFKNIHRSMDLSDDGSHEAIIE